MKFSDIYKAGAGKPSHTDIPKGGMAIDIVGQKAYSKDAKGNIFALGLDQKDVDDAIAKSPYNVPIGGIIMYSGAFSKIPAGWALCNGSNGTPDLRNRFILGTDDQSALHTTGGSADAVAVSHTHSQQPHTHAGSTHKSGSHNHRVTTFKQHVFDNSPVSPCVHGSNDKAAHPSTDWSGEHTHSLSISPSGGHINPAGVSGTNKNLPPYLKLAYILRKQ